MWLEVATVSMDGGRSTEDTFDNIQKIELGTLAINRLGVLTVTISRNAVDY
jgi:hypothetical protein